MKLGERGISRNRLRSTPTDSSIEDHIFPLSMKLCGTSTCLERRYSPTPLPKPSILAELEMPPSKKSRMRLLFVSTTSIGEDKGSHSQMPSEDACELHPLDPLPTIVFAEQLLQLLHSEQRL